MLRCRPLLQQGIRWKLGQSNKIRFWFDNWLDGHNLLDLLNWPRDLVSNPLATVSDFITPFRKWDIAKLSQVIPNTNIIQQIRGIDIPNSCIEDSFCWGLHSSGDFTTKSATWLAHNSKPLSHPDWPFRWIWKIDVMPKIQIFIWQIFHYAIPVRGVLFRRSLNIDPVFPLCLNDIESMDHLFLDCIVSSRVLECAVLHGWISNRILATTTNLCSRLQGIASKPSLRRDLARIFFLLWYIWKGRNGVVFRNEFFQPMVCLVSAKKAFAE